MNKTRQNLNNRRWDNKPIIPKKTQQTDLVFSHNPIFALFSSVAIQREQRKNQEQGNVYKDLSRGVRREVLRGFTESSWGSGGRCEPPSGVRGGAPEDFEINAFRHVAKGGSEGADEPPFFSDQKKKVDGVRVWQLRVPGAIAPAHAPP